MSLKKELIKTFENIASLLEFKGENPFKINAYRNGAGILRSLDDDIEPLIKNGEIKNIKGLGKGLLNVITEYYEKGYSTEYNNLIEETPDGILDFLKINGLGAKKIKLLYTELGISSLGELEAACREDRISAVKGFGKKTQESILKEIERINSGRNFILQSTANKRIEDILAKLNHISHSKKIEVTGQVRRATEVVSSLELLILTDSIEEFKKEAVQYLEIKGSCSFIEWMPDLSEEKFNKSAVLEIESYSETSTVLYITETNEEYNSLLYFTTGSKEFVSTLKRNGLQITGESELKFINSDFPFVIPEMRESEYFEASSGLRENSRLDFKDFKGLLHFHSTYSDGQSTLEEMINEARKLGFAYCTVCDHSKAAFYANGLSEDSVLKQKEEIKGIKTELNFPVFLGIECDILKEGELDYSEEFLENFDFIVASVHSLFKMTEEEMTQRIIKAVENPYTDLLGHPTGRLLLSRAAYQLNIKKIIDACAANNVAIEVNANPFRLDLDWRMIYYARSKGCMFSINPDAHSTEGIRDIHYGIRTARKGGLQPEEVINCFDLEKFKNFLKRRVKREV